MINWENVHDKRSFIDEAKDVLPTIEIDSLTNYGASLLNRDRDGFAKRVIFGGVERGRISSQCIKYAIRQAKSDTDTWYTKTFDVLVGKSIRAKAANASDDYINHARALTLKLLSAGKDISCKASTGDADAIADVILSVYDVNAPIVDAEWGIGDASDVKKVTKIPEVSALLKRDMLTRLNSSEVAMFGRMSTSDILRTVDGAVSMSHAFTTHEYNGDVDTVAAVDELKKFGFGNTGNDRGSSGIWDADINAGCFYQYCNISTMIYALNMLDGMDFNDKAALKRRFATMARDVVEFIKLYLLTAPVAMQTSKASFPGPSVVYIRAGIRPMNHSYENAFARPVYSNGEQDVVSLSARRLTDYINNDKFFDNDYERRYWITDNNYDAPNGATRDLNLSSVLKELEGYIDGVCD